MEESRMFLVNGVQGRRGTGKTEYIKILIAAYRKAHPEQKVLIVDTVDHPKYRDVPTIDVELLKRWKKPNMYRIFGSNTVEIFEAISNHLEDCLIIFEDSSKYLGKSLNDDVKKFIYDSKQKRLDIQFLYHGFMSVPPELFRMLDNIVLFKCDHPSRRKNDLVTYDEVLEVYNRVMKHPSPYYNETVQIF